MTNLKTRALAIFVITSVVLAVIFFVFPINIFNGEIHIVEPHNHKDYIKEAPLSLSYFIGIGYDEADMEFVESFKLTIQGWIMAFIFILGFPALLAYRIYLKYTRSE